MTLKPKVLAIVAMLLLSATGLSQKKQEKPKLHSDFKFGSYPVSREASALFEKENVRLLLVGLQQGWDLAKIAKESKVREEELDRTFADLEEIRLVEEIDQFERHPLVPVIRDRNIEKVQKSLQAHTLEFTNLLRTNWPEIEAAIAPLTSSKNVSKGQMLYQAVVGGILFGSMNDAFFEDQTIMVIPPRRSGSQRYYGWLVESDAKLAGVLKREQWESDGYTIVSVGPGTLQARISLDRVRAGGGLVIEEPEARRVRNFMAIFAKERLLPYFKKNRASFLNALNQLDAGRPVSVSSAFAWYYDQMANGATESLAAEHLIQPPATQYTFALKVPGPR